MAEKHKSKYKAPKDFEKSQKPKPRKDLKDYTEDDKKGGQNPRSTGDAQLNVLRKRDKEMVDTGDMYVKYNDDDRLYKDIETGDYDPKTAAKRLKKRQDTEEKETKDVIKDKIENLTREQKERLVREYVRRKIVKILLEQPTPPTTEEEPAEAPAEEPTTPDATATPVPDATATPTPDAATPPAPDAAMAPTDAAATPDAAATSDTATTPAEPTTDSTATPTTPDSSSETSEVMDLDKFINYLKKQEGNIARAKIAIRALNLALKDADPADQANFYKMIRIAMVKKLASLNSEINSKK